LLLAVKVVQEASKASTRYNAAMILDLIISLVSQRTAERGGKPHRNRGEAWLQTPAGRCRNRLPPYQSIL